MAGATASWFEVQPGCRFPRLSLASYSSTSGDIALVISSTKQMEEVLRGLGANGACFGHLIRATLALPWMPPEAGGHLDYLRLERNALAHDPGRSTAQDLRQYARRYNQALDTIEQAMPAAAPRHASQPALRHAAQPAHPAAAQPGMLPPGSLPAMPAVVLAGHVPSQPYVPTAVVLPLPVVHGQQQQPYQQQQQQQHDLAAQEEAQLQAALSVSLLEQQAAPQAAAAPQEEQQLLQAALEASRQAWQRERQRRQPGQPAETEEQLLHAALVASRDECQAAAQRRLQQEEAEEAAIVAALEASLHEQQQDQRRAGRGRRMEGRQPDRALPDAGHGPCSQQAARAQEPEERRGLQKSQHQEEEQQQQQQQQRGAGGDVIDLTLGSQDAWEPGEAQPSPAPPAKRQRTAAGTLPCGLGWQSPEEVLVISSQG